MIKQMIFSHWSFIRFLRLGFGLLFLVEAIRGKDAILGFISGLFLFQALTNTGCCGMNGCIAPKTKNIPVHTEAIEFEEIKIK